MTKELEGLEECLKAEIYRNLFKTTLKKTPNWKTPHQIGIHRFWFKKFTSILDRLALKRNRSLQGAYVSEWKTTLIQKDPLNVTNPNTCRLFNLLIDDAENINSPNEGRDLLLANKLRIVPCSTERMPQRIQIHWRVTLHRSAHPKQEQDQAEKSSYGLVWLQQGIWYGSTKQDYKLT